MSTIVSLKASVLINNCSFTGNRAGFAGVLIAIQSSVIIIQSVFYKNSAYSSSGALFVFNSSISLHNCTFVKNIAYTRGGGALCAMYTQLTINKSSFSMNVADNGGAILALNGCHITTEYTVFSSNIALNNAGGAVFVANSTMSIHSTDFHNNTAIRGGAVLIVDTNVTVNNCSFILNKAHYNPTVAVGTGKRTHLPTDARGGAVYAYMSNLIVIENKFENNSATVYIHTIPISSITLECDTECGTNVTVITNVAAYGGAIFSANYVTMIDHSIFAHNLVHIGSTSHCNACTSFFYPGVLGGALFSDSSSNNIMIKKSKFIANQANVDYTLLMQSLRDNGDAQAYGFAVGIWMNTAVEITESMFLYNSADLEALELGGALYIVKTSNTKIVNSMFFKNMAGIYPDDRFSYGYHNSCKATIRDVRIKFYIAAMLISNSVVFISNCTFLKNTAYAGSIVGVNYESDIAIYNSSFIQNVADSFQYLYSTVYVDNSAARISNSTFEDNAEGALTVLFSSDYVVELNSCTFKNNSANFIGGSLLAVGSNLSISKTTFMDNTLTAIGRNDSRLEFCMSQLVISPEYSDILQNGGLYFGSAVISMQSNITMNACTLTRNTNMAICSGVNSIITINGSTFHNNAGEYGGGLIAADSTVNIYHSLFTNNDCTSNTIACEGGALRIVNSTTQMYNCKVENNTSYYSGGMLLLHGNISIHDSMFVNNTGVSEGEGGALSINSMSFNSSGSFILQKNTGHSILIATNSTLAFLDNCIVANNHGSLLVFYSNVTFSGLTYFFNNTCTFSPLQGYRSAITSFQSEIVFTGRATLLNNKGITGGALLVRESKVYFYGNTTIVENTASLFGGGMYATQSELNFMGVTYLTGNMAEEKGGGLHIAGTTTRLIGGSLKFVNNTAKHGGAISFEQNAKLYVLKPVYECLTYETRCENADPIKWLTLQFTDNIADYGGALYVNDEEMFGTCAANSSKLSDCFFQALAVYAGKDNSSIDLNFHNTIFSNNEAKFTGNAIFGGLLDRCSVNSFAEVFKKREQFNLPTYLKPLSYLFDYNVTNLNRDQIQYEISSDAVRVCFCHNDLPDCSYQPPTLYVRKGEQFSVTVVAVDQVNTTIPHILIHSVVSPSAGLDEGQAAQITNDSCTDLKYSVVSPNSNELVQLYAEGPCKDSGMSTASLNISFKVCPIGFKDSGSDCECDPDIYPDYITTCSINTGSVLRKDNIWITYVNTTNEEGFLTYLNCPYDYCYPTTEEVWINLNNHNTTDNQCAYSRSGMLCGACKDGLSLTLGSSQCKQCSNNWVVLLIPFSIAGIALVAFLLVCNITVDKATLNGVIFYANVIGTNRAIFFPFKTPNILSIFIAWTNLDFGFETCFSNGMDGYTKTWLQLVFPVYIIILVVLIIISCDYSQRFQELLSRRNPVAVLSTLILLSYTKFLRTIISAFSFAMLDYPNGSREIVWLFDANIEYFGWKHALLFMTALLILILGLMYTLFLLVWQWIQGCPVKPCFKLINNTKLFAFMDAYQNPFNPKHRYWTGVLLLTRVLLYLISALNIGHDPGINLMSIVCVASLLFFLSNFPSNRIYKMWPLSILENSFLLNLILYSTVTSHIRGTQGNQTVVAYISIGIAFCTFMGILFYHTFSFVLHSHLDFLKQLFQTCCKRNIGGGYTQFLPPGPFSEVEFEEPSYTEFDGIPNRVDTEEYEALVTLEGQASEHYLGNETPKQNIFPTSPQSNEDEIPSHTTVTSDSLVTYPSAHGENIVQSSAESITIEIIATSTHKSDDCDVYLKPHTTAVLPNTAVNSASLFSEHGIEMHDINT